MAMAYASREEWPRRALSLNMLRAFSLTAMFFWCISRRIMGLGASRKSLHT